MKKILVAVRLDPDLRRQIREWSKRQNAARPTQEPLTEAAAIRELLRAGLRARRPTT
jgi:hypothetical protein